MKPNWKAGVKGALKQIKQDAVDENAQEAEEMVVKSKVNGDFDLVADAIANAPAINGSMAKLPEVMPSNYEGASLKELKKAYEGIKVARQRAKAEYEAIQAKGIELREYIKGIEAKK